MCAITGILSWNKEDSSAILKKMTQTMMHRGPDACGDWHNEGISLGHRRLSVQDPSTTANQPMHDFSDRYVIVFNGEIYNFKKLKETLAQSGYKFKTHGDTEVILAAWNHWGSGALSYFEGMFVFALWDKHLKELHLVRDRFGEKPLYYFRLPNGGVVFASELKALLNHPNCPKNLNPNAISQFLSLNYILTEQCILEGVHKLAPGNYMVFRENQSPITKSYWSLADSFHASKWDFSEAELIEQFNDFFTDTVRDCSVSDVPLGIFLSGGIDSSAIASSIKRASINDQLKAFTIGFEQKSYNELDKAKLVASNSQIEHLWEISAPDNADFVKKIAENLDEPFADSSMIPMHTLAALARKNATVCLSGDGGDELFGGYETYRADILHNALKYLPFKDLLATIVGHIPVSHQKVSFDYKLKQFTKGLSLSPQQAHYSWRTIFSDIEKKDILQNHHKHDVLNHNPFEGFNKFYNDVRSCDMLEQHFYVDLKTWMVDDILVKVDRISMMHSLEVRSPFLNHKLAEWIIRLPTKYKIRNLRTKYLLKKSQKGSLPHSILYGKKEGFGSPISKWMTRDVVDQIIDNPIICEWLDKDQIFKLWKNHSDKITDCSHKLFGLFCLSSWMNKFSEIEK